jgi:hypothetical protein
MSGRGQGGRVFHKDRPRQRAVRQDLIRSVYPPILWSAQDQENRPTSVFAGLFSPGAPYGEPQTHPTIHDAESRAARAR